MLKYDIVLPVSEQNIKVSKLCVRYLLKFADFSNIYIITAKKNFHHFINVKSKYIKILDENSIVPEIDLTSLEQYMLQKEVGIKRAGWYFQQFLKMGICNYPDISDYYLIWDSDTIMLNPISFFDNQNRVLVNTGNEYHKPYFDTYYKITGKKRAVHFSFITEHLMINKSIMKELIKFISSKIENETHWVWKILNAIEIENLPKAGFSEFETYGNYVMATYPESIEVRPLKHFRYGASMFGLKPNKYDIFRLSLEYSYASFENWDTYKKGSVINEKIRSFILWIVNKPILYLSS